MAKLYAVPSARSWGCEAIHAPVFDRQPRMQGRYPGCHFVERLLYGLVNTPGVLGPELAKGYPTVAEHAVDTISRVPPDHAPVRPSSEAMKMIHVTSTMPAATSNARAQVTTSAPRGARAARSHGGRRAQDEGRYYANGSNRPKQIFAERGDEQHDRAEQHSSPVSPTTLSRWLRVPSEARFEIQLAATEANSAERPSAIG